MGTPLKVLIIEDVEDDALLMVRELQRGGYEPAWTRVETSEELNAALDRQTWDVVLADYTLPHFTGKDALQLTQQRRLDIPFFIVTGTLSEDEAVELMRAGAHDYFIKDSLTRLPEAVSRALMDTESRRDRLQAEAQLAEAFRALRTISRCNKAMIHAERESDLLHAICQVIVETGGHRLAWIGFAVDDTAKTVVPAAWAGFDEDYLADANITWADTERGRGPAGTAIRAGRTIVVRNIATDPLFRPWRAEAVKRGYKSVSAFPLIINQHACGVLEIYSAYAESFTTEELGMIEEMIEDLQYGIRALRMRAAREQAEETLRRERDQVQQYLNVAGVMLLVLSADQKVSLINRKGLMILGCKDAEVVGRDWIDNFVQEGARDRVRASFAALIAGDLGRWESVEYPVLTKTGEERFIAWHHVVLKDAAGKSIAILSSGEDITERKRAEKLLQEKERFLRAIGDNLPKGAIYRVAAHPDGSRQFLYCSAGFATLFGVTPQEAQADAGTIYGLVAEEDRERLRAAEEESARHLTLFECEFRMHNRQGRLLWVQCRSAPTRLSTGSTEWNGIVMDVTDRVQAEEALKETASRLNAVIQASPLAIMVMDLEGRVQLWNQAAHQLYQWSEAEVIGQPVPVVPPNQREHHLAIRDRALREGVIRRLEVMRQRKDGSLVMISLSLVLLRDGAGSPQGFLAMTEDVTAQKQMEAQALRIERLATLGQLLGGIAHELKNPLFVVTGSLQLLKEKLVQQEYDRLDRDIEKIAEAARRMTKIVQQFLSVARPQPITMQSCSVPALLQNVIAFLDNELMRNRIKVVTNWMTDLPLCLGDPTQLSQAFLNLIINAMQAMAGTHGQGTLTVEAKLVANSQQQAASENQRGAVSNQPSASDVRWIEVRIRDDGPGILPEHRAKLFEPFFSTKPSEEGTGLGLWTVRSIVIAMKGTVTCETDVGKGTVFVVRLPVSEELGR